MPHELPQPDFLQLAQLLRRIPFRPLEKFIEAPRVARDLPLVERHGGEEEPHPHLAPSAILLDLPIHRMRMDIRFEDVGQRRRENVVFKECFKNIYENSRY